MGPAGRRDDALASTRALRPSKLKYCYNGGGFKNFIVESKNKLPAGEHQVRMEFAYAGGGMGKSGKATIL